jgi:hypothetical protein
MGLETTVGIAKLGTKSLRATVPEGIVAFLNLESGDKIEWDMEINPKTGKRIAVVQKLGEK